MSVYHDLCASEDIPNGKYCAFALEYHDDKWVPVFVDKSCANKLVRTESASTAAQAALSGFNILVFRMNAELYAIENRCTHLNFPLAGGRQIGCEIICRQHGGRFDIRTGKAVGSPAVDPVRKFDVRLNGNRIEIAL